MWRSILVSGALLTAGVKGIYDPSDATTKPPRTRGIKTSGWPNLHHNYSSVSVQGPSRGAAPDRIVEGTRPVPVRVRRVEIRSGCPKGATGQFVDELSCHRFLNCWKGRGHLQNCAPGTLFNPATLECDHAGKVRCVTGPRQSVLLHHREQLTEETQPGCPGGFSGIIPHYTECSKFISCDRGVGHVMDCPPSTLFDVDSNTCDYPSRARCVNQREGGRFVRVQSARKLEGSDAARYPPYHNPNLQSAFYDQQHYYNGTQDQRPPYDDQSLDSTFSASSGDGRPNTTYVRHRHHHGGYSRHQQGYGLDSTASASSSDGTAWYRPQHRDGNFNRRPSDGDQTNPGAQDGVSSSYHHTNYDEGFDQNLATRTNRSYGQHAVQNSPPQRQPSEVSMTSSLHQHAIRHGSRTFNHRQPYYHRDPSPHQTTDASSAVSYDGTYEQSLESASFSRGEATDQQDSGHRPHHHRYQPLGHGQSNRAEPKCPEGYAGLHEHPTDCFKFLSCANGITYVLDCAPGTLFNPLLKVCDFPYNVNCSRGGDDLLPSTTTDWPEPEVNRRLPKATTPSSVDDYEQAVYRQQNKNFQHRPRVDDTDRPRTGFYITRPPQVVHTSQPLREEGNHGAEDPSRSNRGMEPDGNVDYVYEYDDDIIVNVQPAASNRPQSKGWCRTGEFACPHRQCISGALVCNGLRDCPGGEDEINCDSYKFTLTKNNKLAVAEKKKISNTTVVSCSKYCLDEISFQCRAFNYRKHDGICYLLDRNIGLSGALIIYQIFDYYELTSLTLNCTSLFKCPNNKCVSYSSLCDGQNDCGDRTDEKHCSSEALGYSIRLVGSPDSNEGKIQVSAFGKTGYVCDDQFGIRDADVVCRELGFTLGALEVKGNSYYDREGASNDTFYLMDDVSCHGNESSLRDCDFGGWGVHNCMGQEVAGVVCKTPEERCQDGYWQCQSGQECIPIAFLCDNVYDCTDSSDENDEICEAPTELRLANGSTHLEGRVEIKHMGTWGTICDDDFNEDAAKVVCKYFGFDGSAAVRKNSHFGAGKGPIWLDQVFCQGNESEIQNCVHWDWGEHNCDHSEDVGVVCSQSGGLIESERHSHQPIEEPPKVEPLELLPERCGYRKDNIFGQDDEVHFRVVKGTEAKQGDYPWQASIRVKGKTNKPTHWCGAVVISQRFVLTAAHCLVGFSKSAYLVVAGDYRVDEAEGTEQVALIEDFYLHEDFRKVQKMNNDIALVKLKGNGFTITDDVQPICLPDTDVDYETPLNCTISGFGSTKSGKASYSHVLRAGWIPLQMRSVCKMPHVYGSAITEGMICAGYLEEGVDACDGDSGGPLACLHDGVFTLYGLTSWGQHCGYANKPGVYVKISHYRDWIEDNMKKYA